MLLALLVVLLLLVLLPCAVGAVASARCLPAPTPRGHAEPLVFLGPPDAFRQARAAATWPDELRPRGAADWLCVYADGAELFPRWDEQVRASARDGLVSHPLRRCLRALAWPRTPSPAPPARARGLTFPCPDPRCFAGRQDLVRAAAALAAGSALSAFRLGLWLREAEVPLVAPALELAYLPGSEGGALAPSELELAAARLELGSTHELVLPAL